METGDTFTLDLANDLIIVDSDIFANILIILARSQDQDYATPRDHFTLSIHYSADLRT